MTWPKSSKDEDRMSLRQLAAHPSWLILKTFLMSLGTVHDDAVNELQLVAREH